MGKRMIYAVKAGRKTGIFKDWLKCFEQTNKFSGAKYHSFKYMEELEDEDENVENSLRYAMKQAENYLSGLIYYGVYTDYLDDESWQTDGYLPFGEDESALEDEDEHANDPMPPEAYKDFNQIDLEDELPFSEDEDMFVPVNALEHTGVDDDVINLFNRVRENCPMDEAETVRLYKDLQMEFDGLYNSGWLNLLLKVIGEDKPIIANGNYCGRYSCYALYTAILYMVLAPNVILDHYKLLYLVDEHGASVWVTEMSRRWQRSEEYRWLYRRFQNNDFRAEYLPELRFRCMALGKQFIETECLVNKPVSYLELKKYIQEGKRTLIDIYQELTQNQIYRSELSKLTLSFPNPDLEKIVEIEEPEASMQQLVLQTNAISVALKCEIVGQDAAIEKLEKAYFHTEKAVRQQKKRKRPRNVFFLAGPPGVGKTFMAELFAKAVGISYRRYDMTGYSSVNAADELAGISSFYRNSKPGVLTSYVHETPQCVLLFDEIEKAHSTVIQLFLQILDEGVCFDRFYDRNVDFSNTILIFTSNAGRQLYSEAVNEDLTSLPDQVVINALEKDVNPETKIPYFPTELLSRMSSHTVIMMNHLEAAAIRKIVGKEVDRQLMDHMLQYGYDLKEGKEFLTDLILYSMGGNADARNASIVAGKIIDKELYEFLSLVEEKFGLDRQGDIRQIDWKFDLADATDEIREFFYGERDCVIPLFGETGVDVDQKLKDNHVVVKETRDINDFMDMIHKENVLFAVIDYAYGYSGKKTSLHIKNEDTLGKKVFDMLRREDQTIPVFVLNGDNVFDYSLREMDDLMRNGVAGFINRDSCREQLTQKYEDVCCQKAMETLTLRHQVLTYDAKKELNQEMHSGCIIFQNLKLEMAVETEDRSSFISNDLRPQKKWDDIYVSDDVKDELTYFIHYLQNPKEYVRKGVRPPKGVLMYGPPGTGKTSLAKVVATESDVNFLSVSADELMNGGADKVHQLFRVARKYAPAVFFIDEIDAIGVNRNVTGTNAVLNALLTEMDGFKKVDDKPVFIMAATNLGGRIDPALVRRFDRTFCVNLPDKQGRRWILNRLISAHSNMFALTEREIDSILDRSEGMSPAALENIVEAALREGIRSDEMIDDKMFDDIFEKSQMGEEREIPNEYELKNTAYHEAGHALILLHNGRHPKYLSIVARGSFGGYVKNDNSHWNPSKEFYLQSICMCLGGRAAELEFGYGLTAGASSDIEKATQIAKQMVCRYGMYADEIGLAAISEEELLHHDAAKQLINRILEEQLALARTIIAEKREVMERLVTAVMDSGKKYLTEKEILEAYTGEKLSEE